MLGPLVVVLDRLDAAGTVAVFVLAAAALIPLAWLIGEATENAAHYTGAGFGGFLNATFGNAPELIVALIAVSNGLPDVVRASLVGSIVGNLLLVLGFTLLLGRTGEIDRTSALISLAQVAVVTLVLLVPALPGLHGDPDRHSLAVLSLVVAAAILAARPGRQPLRLSPAAATACRCRVAGTARLVAFGRLSSCSDWPR